MRRLLVLLILVAATALTPPAAADHRLFVGCPDLVMGGRVYVTYGAHISCRIAHRHIRRVRLGRGAPADYSCRVRNGGWRRSSGGCSHEFDDDKMFGWYPPH